MSGRMVTAEKIVSALGAGGREGGREKEGGRKGGREKERGKERDGGDGKMFIHYLSSYFFGNSYTL